jgi:NTE family protein
LPKALVLSGGGPLGVAWQTGLAVGLARSGVRLAEADLIVGTSAGSVVGAQLALGKEMGALLEQVEHFWAGQARSAGESGAAGDAGTAGASAVIAERMQTLLNLMADATTSDEGIPAETRVALGRFALEADAGPEERFAGAFAFLARDAWPARFRCTAVDAESGTFVVWDGRGGENLDRAVASSCAVPGIFPPITVRGRRYIDGGMRSGTNADLAQGNDRVLIVTLVGRAGAAAGPENPVEERFRLRLEAEQAVLVGAGANVRVVGPDEKATAVMGLNMMDASIGPAAAEAGTRQGETLGAELADFWD